MPLKKGMVYGGAVSAPRPRWFLKFSVRVVEHSVPRDRREGISGSTLLKLEGVSSGLGVVQQGRYAEFSGISRCASLPAGDRF